MEVNNTANPLASLSTSTASTPSPDLENGKGQPNAAQPVDYKLYIIASTNELLAAKKGVTVPSYLLSIAISALQILLFIAIIDKSTNFDKPDLSFELVVVRIFIAIYLPAYLVHSISDAFWSVFDGEDEFSDIQTFLFLFMFILFLPLMTCVGFAMTVSRGEWDEMRSTMATLLEYSVLVTSLAATLLITKQQTDIISSVFNFAGLLLVLELDDMVARLLKWKIIPYDPTSDSTKDQKDLAKVKAHNNSVMQMTVFCVMFVPSLVYLLE